MGTCGAVLDFALQNLMAILYYIRKMIVRSGKLLNFLTTKRIGRLPFMAPICRFCSLILVCAYR